MRNRTTTTKWNMFFQFSSIILMILSGIILVPLYLTYIPIEMYGAWLATGNVLVWITIVDPGLSQVLQERIALYYGARNFQKIGETIVTGLFFTLIICIILLLVGLFFYLFLPFLKYNNSIDESILSRCYLLALLGCFLQVFSFSVAAINQGLQSSKGTGFIYILITTSGIFISAYLLVNNYGLLSVAVVPLISGFGLTIGNVSYLIWRYKKDEIPFIRSIANYKEISSLLSFSFMSRIGGVLSTSFDLFLVAKFLGPHSAAILNITRKAPEMSKSFIERPAIAFIPSLAHLRGSGNVEKLSSIIHRLIFYLIWTLGLVIAGFIILNEEFVYLWVGKQFFAGKSISIIISVSVMFAAVNNSFSNLSIALGAIKLVGVISIVQSFLTIILTVIGIHFYGLMGLVIGNLISHLISFSLYPRYLFAILNLSQIMMKQIFQETLKVIILILLIVLLLHELIVVDWFSFILLFGAIIFLFTSLLFIVSIYFRNEAKLIFSKIKVRYTNQ